MWLIPLSFGVQPCEAYGNKDTVTASTGSLLRPPTFQIQQPPAPTPAVARTGFNACETRETPVCSTLLPQTSVSSSALVDHLQYYQQNPDSLFLLAESAGYSLASYYTSLGLFVISVPGLWSLIKRSVKSKIVQKTFIGEGAEKKAPNRVAGEILSFFTRNNFVVTTNRGETITGADYWKRASRKEQIKVKLLVAEDGTVSEIVAQGDDQQVDQMRKELKLGEKGMVYVKGIFER